MRNSLLLALLLSLLATPGIARASDVPVARTTVMAGSSQISFYDLFRSGIIRNASLSPSGELIAYQRENHLLVGNADLGMSIVDELTNDIYIRSVDWSSDRVLFVAAQHRQSEQEFLIAYEIGSDGGELTRVRFGVLQVEGYVFDPLLDEDEWIVFGKPREHEDGYAADLFRLNLFAEEPDRHFRKRLRLNVDTDHLYYYLQDPGGAFNFGIAYREGNREIWQRANEDSDWELLWTAPDQVVFIPYGVSDDGKTVWALSNIATDKIAAVAFSLETASVSQVLFQHERYDLYSIVMSNVDNQPVGATYVEEGLYRYEFFDEADWAEYDFIRDRYPDRGFILMDRSEDGGVQLILVSSDQNPGEIHMCTREPVECHSLGRTKPWLADTQLVETIPLQIESSDGLVIEAFLTLPSWGYGSWPLLAYPHGGPIGPRDYRYFSPEVQWFALNGYAVLQVNYRGSGGYGREFQTAGLREWGRGIEDDIEASIAHALREYPQIDGDRIGIFGISYGGYSALMSAIRRPDLFLCAASFAGPTDLTLLFDRVDVQYSERRRERWAEIVGDPTENRDELIEFSPVYQYRQFQRPLFIGHGDADRIVDVEHAYRLQSLLELNGADSEFLILEDVGHGPRRVREARDLYGPLVEFLDRHLKPAN
ncbi:MAG: prolyl oligopeptidase family serine peptidase [Woeseiaceae bacterium]|nr:prolyl oligopeptidase family serine peptidase [Woeseiaceae bacterium]